MFAESWIPLDGGVPPTSDAQSDIDASATASAAAGPLPLRIQAQQDTGWCWAAVTQYLLGCVGIEKSQCRIATEHYARVDSADAPRRVCCPDESGFGLIGCNEAEDLQEVLAGAGFVVAEVKPWNSPGWLAEHLARGGLACARITAVGGHFIVISRLLRLEGVGDFVEFLDPKGGEVRFCAWDQLGATYCNESISHLYLVRTKESAS